jgi:hypothetical protein
VGVGLRRRWPLFLRGGPARWERIPGAMSARRKLGGAVEDAWYGEPIPRLVSQHRPLPPGRDGPPGARLRPLPPGRDKDGSLGGRACFSDEQGSNLPPVGGAPWYSWHGDPCHVFFF